MQPPNRFLDDLSHLLSGAAAALSGVRNELEGLFQQQLERIVASMDLVGREEFDSLRAMTQNARSGQENLEKKLATIKGQSFIRGAETGRHFQHLLLRRNTTFNLRRAARLRRKIYRENSNNT